MTVNTLTAPAIARMSYADFRQQIAFIRAGLQERLRQLHQNPGQAEPVLALLATDEAAINETLVSVKSMIRRQIDDTYPQYAQVDRDGWYAQGVQLLPLASTVADNLTTYNRLIEAYNQALIALYESQQLNDVSAGLAAINAFCNMPYGAAA